ncbi:hypothetical protein C6P45_001913 [Maudiozyma exigua]|uniref:Mitochondrial carrier protein n=1 Tax=Maudiozyma exigua TaxID=34358 RepID=A0A9P7BE02_MAUEX|nr:hypothetical protein C6P45_001913 [Kazachstania exigua]
MNATILESDKKETHLNSLIGALTAAVRTVIFRLTTFYLRVPLKLFRPPRFDYLHYLRISYFQDSTKVKNSSIYERTSINVLHRALKQYGWRIIPERILPPLLVNSFTGILLYTSYLQISSYLNTNVTDTYEYYLNIYKSGWFAGLLQGVVSSPVDAIIVRQNTEELIRQINKHDSIWKYAWPKWKQIGFIGCYGGCLLTLFKESMSFGAYFWSFEYIKQKYKGKIRDSKYIHHSIIFVSGVTAALILQLIQYPITKIERIHHKRLEAIDTLATTYKASGWRSKHVHLYRNAYGETFTHLRQIHAGKHLQFTKWLYKGFTRNTVAVIPGTTAGLLFLNYLRSQTEQPILI